MLKRITTSKLNITKISYTQQKMNKIKKGERRMSGERREIIKKLNARYEKIWISLEFHCSVLKQIPATHERMTNSLHIANITHNKSNAIYCWWMKKSSSFLPFTPTTHLLDAFSAFHHSLAVCVRLIANQIEFSQEKYPQMIKIPINLTN